MGRSKGKSISRSRKWGLLLGSNEKEKEREKDKPRSEGLTSTPVAPSRSKSGSIHQRRRSGNTEEGEAKPEHKSKEKCEISKEEEKKEKKDSADKKKDKECDASIFEAVDAPSGNHAAQTGTHGIKNKMRWKLDVEPINVLNDPKMDEVLAKYKALRKQKGPSKSKVRNKNSQEQSDDDNHEEDIVLCAKILQIAKLSTIVDKEIPDAADQEALKTFCRAGGDDPKIDGFIEKIALAVLSSVVTRNSDCCRSTTIPGQLRMFAVEEKVAKYPMMAILHARKDLFYIAWSKKTDEMDTTWNCMLSKKTKS